MAREQTDKTGEAMLLTIPEMRLALRKYGCRDAIGDAKLREYAAISFAQQDKILSLISPPMEVLSELGGLSSEFESDEVFGFAIRGKLREWQATVDKGVEG